jgi:hypothetical protein
MLLLVVGLGHSGPPVDQPGQRPPDQLNGDSPVADLGGSANPRDGSTPIAVAPEERLSHAAWPDSGRPADLPATPERPLTKKPFLFVCSGLSPPWHHA